MQHIEYNLQDAGQHMPGMSKHIFAHRRDESFYQFRCDAKILFDIFNAESAE